MRYLTVFTTGLVGLMAFSSASAAVTTVPDAALVASTSYYTDQIGGGLGISMVSTGGGTNANVGAPNGRNDDGFQGPIPLGFSVNFFGNSYNSFYLNNNGNISFGGGNSDFSPNGPQSAPVPVIAPFFADVDTRSPLSGVPSYRLDIPNELIVTWDNVGYYNMHADQTDSFQLVLRGANYNTPAGEGSIGLFYKTMGWESADFAGNPNGGTPASVGFGDGNANGVVLQGSSQRGIAAIVNDTHIWFDANMVPVAPVGCTDPVACPEPVSASILGVSLAGMLALRRRRSRRA